jgi:hypothetical protein
MREILHNLKPYPQLSRVFFVSFSPYLLYSYGQACRNGARRVAKAQNLICSRLGLISIERSRTCLVSS